jgi:repressor LexA
VYSANGVTGPNGFLAVKSLSISEDCGIPFHQTAHQNQNYLSQAVLVPLIGRIRAGEPNEAEEVLDDVFPLPRHLVGGGKLFLLKVVGDSMIDFAISDGDWVVVRQQPTAEDGEIVAAMIDGRAMVKKLKRVGGRVQLMPGNAAYATILGDQATILGKVVVVLRRL